MRTHLVRSVALWFLLIATLSLATGLVEYAYLVEAGRKHEQLERSQCLLNRLGALHGELTDIETGARGFVITGEDRHLGPYDHALPRIEPTMGKLAELTVHDPEHRGQVLPIEPLVDAQRAILRQMINVRRAEGPESDRLISLIDQGKDVMDRIRGIIVGMDSVENARLLRRVGEAKAINRRMAFLLAGGIVVNLGLLWIVFGLVARETAIRRARSSRSARARSDSAARSRPPRPA